MITEIDHLEAEDIKAWLQDQLRRDFGRKGKRARRTLNLFITDLLRNEEIFR